MTHFSSRPQPCRIGIDFGTTHTSAALYDGHAITAIPLDPQNANSNLLRSMIYVNRAQQVHLGLDAVKTFLEQDTGREVVFEEKVVGTLTNTVASHDAQENITIVYDTFIEEDVGIRGRLLQSIKTGLRGDSYKGTTIFGRYYRLQELIALLLRHVRHQASDYLGQEITAATLGRPVQFIDDPAADQRAEARLREAAELAGFTAINFVPEPVAAAAFYLAQVTAPETVLIFDFGGGTLDLTLLRANGQGSHSILATHGVLVGGDDLDSAMMQHIVAPHFGSESPIDINFDDQPIPFPADLAELLYLWQSIPNLSRPQALKVINRALRYSPEREKFVALEALVTRNHGFALFERIEQAKRRLSDVEETTLTMQADAIELALPLRRKRFNRAIGNEVSDARLGVRAILATAELPATAVDAVVTTGGSSVIPLFQKMLATELPAARFVQLDTFGGVTSGLAMRAHQQSVGVDG